MGKIKFFGSRGSYTLTDKKYMEFGGATTCILFNLNNAKIMLDCGSGINNALDELKNIDELHLLISHSHLDHISGISTLLSAFADKPLHIYGKAFNGIHVSQIIDNIMSKSLWPVRASSYSNVVFHDIDDDFYIDDILIKNMDSNHPGECSLFRMISKEDDIVTAFDFSHLNGFEDKLVKFAKGCKTLIYDGCFSEEELEEKASWGHSTPEAGIRIAKNVGCEDLLITHFGSYTDSELSSWEQRLQKDFKNIRFARSGQSQSELMKMVEIGVMLAGEVDNDALLTKIVESSMDITNADGGTLYIEENNKLEFKVLINKSKGTKLIRKEESLEIPSVSLEGKNACAEAAREKKLINISNIYEDKKYDFSGAKVYDQLNDYLTQSIIVIPMLDEFNDVIGVLQLINAKDADDNIISFQKQDEDVLMAIANQASMAIVNSSYSKKINDLLFGFVKVMSVEIDERTPYNANHTKNMVHFAENFFNYEDKLNGPYSVDFKKRREILMSIWLHDVGKILTPIEIMNKDSRLGSLTQVVENRFERRDLLLRLSSAKDELTNDEYELRENERKHQRETISLINKIGFLNEDLKSELDNIATKTYQELDGSMLPVITKEEHYLLSIVKGTLSKEERLVMEGHASMTQKFLSQLNFPKYYNNIPAYAGNHHEFLNGTGYPNHLVEKDLPWPCRLITICDIFEALTAKDRPYKKPFSPEKSIEILRDMASKNQLDNNIIDEFEKSKCWED